MGKTTTLIFLADDDEDDRMMFGEALSETSVRARLQTANDGEKLLSLLHTCTTLPDVIFLDLNMPNKNGVETLKELRQAERFSRIPVIIYSTSNNEVDIEYTYRLGANLYVEKPYSYNDLVHALSEILALDLQEMPRATREEYRFRIASHK
jgi:CheY-like chemotaxis protein